MNPFQHSILSTTGDIAGLTLRLTGADTQLDSLYWFIGYKSVDFPEVVCDKDYFFIYSTDHSSLTGAAIAWGKGNNLDLSDFIEVAKINIAPNYQSETPQLIRIPSVDGNVLHLYIHTDSPEPGNDNKQQTRLFTASGGNELHLNTWNDLGRPLGIVTDENHTGYFRGYERGVNDYIATHIAKGGLPQPWKQSTSTDGRTWTRGVTVDTITGTESGYFAQLSDGLYFEKYGIQWWIGQLHPESGSGIFDADKKIALCKSVTPFGELEQVKLLNAGKENLRHTLIINGDLAHIFITNPKTDLYHGTYDLTDLENYI